ncbi:hypothetical protein Bresa_01737|uniref:Uncharacterized protein n=1 Tax=Brenneria salicis ATCC 15712 = DSM 30166 TaxID=714314 RepID=A0A366I782_9GAMM|nr:hypothetical protein [Brenneria salicis ATCC 15712 = DSM 30166]RBP63012.1 hypothetical protein DES54_11326 [Brenneria salicis ATCC 15712 = DSM 30166]
MQFQIVILIGLNIIHFLILMKIPASGVAGFITFE